MHAALGLLVALVSSAAADVDAPHQSVFALNDSAEVPAIRSYFFAGGEYQIQGNDTENHVLVSQMYVEKLVPVHGVSQELPIVLFHGRGQTGSNFLNTPDGRRGWASDFVAAGHEVYIVDEPFRARSPWEPGHGAPALVSYSAEHLQQYFTATAQYGLWPDAALHTQWPGAGVMGDAVFDQFYAACVPFLPNSSLEQAAAQAAGVALLERIARPAVLVGHSQGGPLPLLLADQRPEFAAALILLEPAGPPFREVVFSNETKRDWGVTEIAMSYDPPVTDPVRELVKAIRTYDNPPRRECIVQADSPPPRKLKNVSEKNILVVTAESSYHHMYDHCTVDFLRQAGCQKLEHVYLEEIGIKGNGHMMFMEKNSHEIQMFLHKWIGRVQEKYQLHEPTLNTRSRPNFGN